MSPPHPTSPADRRVETGLEFDRASGLLRIGHHERRLPEGYDNREVLVAYVELTARSRGDRVANVTEVRQGDVDALAAALDLDAADLGHEIERVLGTTRAEALKVVSRLRSTRVIGGITKAATSAAVAGLLVSGCRGASDPAQSTTRPPEQASTTTVAPGASPAPSTVASTETSAPADDQPVVDGPLTVDEDGNGLIPPVSIDAEGNGLIPPAQIDNPDQPGEAERSQ